MKINKNTNKYLSQVAEVENMPATSKWSYEYKWKGVQYKPRSRN